MSDYLLAEAGIRVLHARYADAVWRKDFDAFGDCFAQDAEWRIGGMLLKTREAIVPAFREIMTHFDRILLTFRSPILELNGPGAASARTYVDERTARKGGGPGTAIGLYYERFVDEGDRWRFKWRLWQS